MYFKNLVLGQAEVIGQKPEAWIWTNWSTLTFQEQFFQEGNKYISYFKPIQNFDSQNNVEFLLHLMIINARNKYLAWTKTILSMENRKHFERKANIPFWIVGLDNFYDFPHPFLSTVNQNNFLGKVIKLLSSKYGNSHINYKTWKIFIEIFNNLQRKWNMNREKRFYKKMNS